MKIRSKLSLVCGSFLVLGALVCTAYEKDFKLPWSDRTLESRIVALTSEREIKTPKGAETICGSDVVEISRVKQSFIDWFLGRQVELDVTFQEDELTTFLEDLLEPNRNASFSIGTDGVSYQKAVQGVEFDVTKVKKYVEENFISGNLDISSFCKTVDFDTDAQFALQYENSKWINDWSVCYSSGTCVDSRQIYENIDLETGEVDLKNSEAIFADVLEALHRSYDKAGTEFEFKTHGGKKIDVEYKTAGTEVDDEEELEALGNLLTARECVENRTPRLNGHNFDSKNYIEISISKQHVWHYVDGKVCCQSDCVTGDVTKNRGTPKGAFEVSECINGKYLTGAGYKTWVNKWMRLTNSGIGLHDASWRSSFGESIYKGHGSHGCINLPPKYAAKLFKEIEPGEIVIIY